MLNSFFSVLYITNKRLRNVAFLTISIFLSSVSFNILANASIPAPLLANNLSNQAAIKFKHLLSSDGLSQNNIFSITQDNQGFIWIATEDGLNRYDGENFVHYRNNLSDPNSVTNNFIRKVFVDNKGTLWVGTQKGLSRYNPNLDNFDNFYHNSKDSGSLRDDVIWEIYQDLKNTIWVSTSTGVHKFIETDEKFERINIRGLEDKLHEVKTIFQDDKNNYWFGTYENGIYLVNEGLNYSSSLQQENNNWHITIPASSLFSISKIDSNYWLGTDLGVYVLDENYNLINHFDTKSENKLVSDKVRSIVQLDDNEIWVGTESGISIISKDSNKTQTVQHTQEKRSLTQNRVFSLHKDFNGNLWIGTYGKGINFFLKDNQLAQHLLSDNDISIDIIKESSDGKIWLYSTSIGLNYINNLGILTPVNIIDEGNIFDIVPSKNNELFISTNYGTLFKYDIDSNETVELKKWNNQSLYNDLYALHLYNEKIWFIDLNGKLTHFDINTNEFTRFSSLEFGELKGLEIDENGTLWTTTSSNQLLSLELNGNNSPKTHFELDVFSKITNLAEIDVINIRVSNDYIWLTSEQGVILLDKKTKSSTYFNENNGLKNNLIFSIILDSKGIAWLSSNGNISLIDPETHIIKNLSNNFYLDDNAFVWGAAFQDSNQNLLFGGSNGYHKFNKDIVSKLTQELSYPVFTKLLIANKEVKINARSTFDENTFQLMNTLSQTDLLTLKHEQSPFSIEFISPNTKLPNQVGYRYRLLELEKNWIEAGEKNHRATYTNLSAGDYVFEVEVYDLLNTTASKKSHLKIHILAPWWLSQSAIIIYALGVFLIIAYVLQQMRHKRLYHLQIQKSEERLKLSLWGSGDEMWDWNIQKGKIYRSNIWGILEFPQDGKRNVGADKTNIHEHDISRVRDALNKHFDEGTDHFESTYRVKNKENKWIWVLDRGKIVERNDKGEPTRMTGTLKDISQIKKADERLKLFAKCIENISDAVVIYDRTFTIVDINKAFQRITGKSKTQMLGSLLRFNQYPDSFTQNVKKHLITKGSWYGEIESKRENGEKYLTDLNIDIIRDENRNISHFVGVFSDITKRKETEAELRKLANSDTLTGLPNRSYFQANQSHLVKNKVPHALLVFDLDNFKKVNDSMGHEVGDVLLCKVAERMRNVGRKQDTVYRLGGDEFSIIIEDTNDIHTITTIAKEILRTIALPLKLKSQEIVLYSSIGIVLYPEDGASPQELLKNADTAMYHAKHNGGNKYQFFSDSMNKKAVKRLQIENLIRHGLKEDFFSVFYQPKIEIATGKIAGMEALVRFETPSKGIISPLTFIPVSEETGQIIDIGEVVLRKSCFATKKWVDAGLFNGRIAVNLSAVQFTQPNLVGMISDILQESQLPSKYLELEITEGTVMDSPQKAIDTMLQIRSMGIHLSLDDFGTGYSSLAYLKKFPLNTLKIDKAFVDDIEESEQGRNMVATIVTIAHNLGMQVVAEGVETNQQLSFLSGLRCEQLQGYLYSKPLPTDDFQKYLLSHQITNKSTSFGNTSI